MVQQAANQLPCWRILLWMISESRFRRRSAIPIITIIHWATWLSGHGMKKSSIGNEAPSTMVWPWLSNVHPWDQTVPPGGKYHLVSAWKESVWIQSVKLSSIKWLSSKVWGIAKWLLVLSSCHRVVLCVADLFSRFSVLSINVHGVPVEFGTKVPTQRRHLRRLAQNGKLSRTIIIAGPTVFRPGRNWRSKRRSRRTGLDHREMVERIFRRNK